MKGNDDMTERIYENDAYCRNFSAVVEDCKSKDGKYYVVLNRTAFFPEGGGQDADLGTINGIEVLDVQREGDTIYHTLASELSIGEEVSCEIDWDVRFSRMQSHTGEHILSGIVHAMFGYDNVGFHMGETSMIVDFNGALTQEDIKKIEISANQAVYKNADVVAYYPSVEELEKLQYRSKLDLDTGVRIVSIGEDIDCCACCAPHVAKTGEVGIIKVLEFGSYKQGTRIEMVAGIHALMDYLNLNGANKELMKILSVPRFGIVEAVREKNTAYQTLRWEYQNNAKRLALLELDLVEISDAVYTVAENLTFDELRYCANQLVENKYDTCMLFSKNGEDGYIYVVSSKNKDVRETVKKLNETFSGKGGGQSNYAQGKIGVFPEAEIKNFVENTL